MGKSRVALTAIGYSCFSFLCIFLAFVSPSWLVTDGTLKNPKFEKLGLWFICFENFTDIRHHYDTVFSQCWWVYEEEYYIIFELLLPGFFIATQFFFTICFILVLVAVFLILMYSCMSSDNENLESLLIVIGADMFLSAICGTVAIILFAINGDSRVWMPNWEHNNMGWSFVAAIMGTSACYVAAILYLVESRVRRIKHRRFADPDYNLRETRRFGGNTDI